MHNSTDERSLNAYARLGGFMYLFVLAVSMASDLLIAGFHVRGDFAQTAANIQASELLYRTGLALQALACVTLILLGGALYVLLKQVDRNLALFALLWWVAEATLGAVFTIFMFMLSSVYTGGASAFSQEEMQVLASLLRDGERTGFTLAVICFSMGSIIFFHLQFKSRFIPRPLAAFGLLASALVTLLGFVRLIAPAVEANLSWLWMPIPIAEGATGLWLLIRGANFEWWNNRSEVVAPAVAA